MKSRRGSVAIASGFLALVLTACGSEAPTAMPDVVGLTLDTALSDIERSGFNDDVEIIGGGLFGVIEEGNWVVCEQSPAPNQSVVAPRLTVERECEPAEEPAEEPIEPPAPSEPSETVAPPEVNAVDTSVDELLDRLNSSDMGGIQVGERFRFTGELGGSDFWSTGPSGDYVVFFTAKGGADDLMVLVDESDASGWTDGTRLDVVVENVELTLNGETDDGWLRMISSTPAN